MDKLWYRKPALLWRQALPIGNGITGVMIYGGKRKETLAFNDSTLWSGYPKDQTNPESIRNIDKVRELIYAGKNSEADKLAMEKLIGHYSESFLPLGKIIINFNQRRFNKYQRVLDIANAIHTISYNETKREAFVSYPDKVAVYHITSKKPFNISISAASKIHSEVTISDNALILVGNAPDYVAPNYLFKERKPIHYNEGKGMSFCLRTEVNTDGDISYKNKQILINNAKTVTLYMITATGFIGYDKMPITDRNVVMMKSKADLACLNKNYNSLKSRHITDYARIFNRQSLSLKSDIDISSKALINLAKGGDVKTGLIELFYNYGKYLTISGSRNGGQSMNLQGLWNNKMRPPWSSNYTTNINAEMNYWGASNSNLSECIEPYLNLIYEIMQAGKHTAGINYNCSGFACNHNVDIWRKTAPVQGSPNYMYSPLCGIWLSNEIYEHYKNGQLEKYKDKIFEIIAEAVKFSSSYLVEHDGYLVTCPSASPEADFIINGTRCNLDYASTFEMSLIRQLYNNYLEIESNSVLSEVIKMQIPRLYPFKEGSTGILEWHKDYEIAEKGHRHFSPLYAFYPGRVIKYYENPEETKWIKKLFDYRTNNSKQYIGWSAAWAICLAGRLHDSMKALNIINSMLSHSVFNNLFCVHPPFLFQIDGNLGFVGGINEMLVYEENGIIELLPALPISWEDGEMKGFVIRGAVISFKWKKGKITNITSDKPIKVMNKLLANDCKITRNINLVDNLSMATNANKKRI